MTGNRGLAMGVLIFASFMDLLDATIVNIALPSIRVDLDASGSQLEWVVGGYLLSFAVLMITGGRLGDIFGRRRLFVIGVLGFTAGSALACFAPTIGVLLVARVVQGGFAAMMVPQVLSSVQSLYAPRERPAVYGVIGAVSGMSAVIGPVLGGWLVSSDAFGIGWRSIFLINLPIGAVLLVLAVRWVPETRSEHPLRLDPVGLVLATAGLLGVVYALVEGRQQDWAAWIWAVGLGGVVVLAAFVVQQVRRPRLPCPPHRGQAGRVRASHQQHHRPATHRDLHTGIRRVPLPQQPGQRADASTAMQAHALHPVGRRGKHQAAEQADPIAVQAGGLQTPWQSPAVRQAIAQRNGQRPIGEEHQDHGAEGDVVAAQGTDGAHLQAIGPVPGRRKEHQLHGQRLHLGVG